MPFNIDEEQIIADSGASGSRFYPGEVDIPQVKLFQSPKQSTRFVQKIQYQGCLGMQARDVPAGMNHVTGKYNEAGLIA